MTTPTPLHKNQNHIVTKIIAWSLFGSFAIIASIIYIKYFFTQDQSVINSITNAIARTSFSIIAYVAMPIINIALIYTSTNSLRKKNKLNIEPIYAIFATICISLILIMTLSASDLLLKSKISIVELVSNNFITSSILTTIVFFAINIQFENDDFNPFLIALTNILAGTIISIPIMMNLISARQSNRLTGISAIASIVSSSAIVSISFLLILLIACFADEKH